MWIQSEQYRWRNLSFRSLSLRCGISISQDTLVLVPVASVNTPAKHGDAAAQSGVVITSSQPGTRLLSSAFAEPLTPAPSVK